MTVRLEDITFTARVHRLLPHWARPSYGQIQRQRPAPEQPQLWPHQLDQDPTRRRRTPPHRLQPRKNTYRRCAELDHLQGCDSDSDAEEWRASGRHQRGTRVEAWRRRGEGVRCGWKGERLGLESVQALAELVVAAGVEEDVTAVCASGTLEDSVKQGSGDIMIPLQYFLLPNCLPAACALRFVPAWSIRNARLTIIGRRHIRVALDAWT
jgi:hypothetical protein